MVKASKTIENPAGNVRTAYQRLKEKYEPSTTPQLMQFTKDFHTKVLLRNQDPDLFITDLEALKVKMSDLGHIITDQSLILHVLNNLDENYEMEVKMLEHRIQMLKEANKEISLEEVRSELNLRYQRMRKTKAQPIDHAYYMGQSFRGKCNWCGKIGHKSTECRSRIQGKPKSENNNNGNSNNNNNSKTNTYNNNNGNRNNNYRPNSHGNGYNNNNNNGYNNNNSNNYNTNTNNNNTNSRKNLFCSYCHKKGHDISECRLKKRNENGNDEMNLVK
jgi:hypothetical protein